jgi:ATP-binding cassette subfamily B protein
MKYVSSAGDHKIEQPGALIVRASRISTGLKWPFIGTILVAIVATVVRLLGPLVVRGGIDQGIDQGDKKAILVAAGIYVILLVIQYFVTAVSQWSIAWVGERYLVQLRGVVFSRILRLDMGFFSRSKSGVLVSRMTADIESLQEFASDGAVMALSNFLTVIGVSIALVLVDWQMALAVFGIVVVLLVVSVIFQMHARKAYDLVRERIGAVLATLQEGITGVRVVQAFTQERDQASTFGRINEGHFEANMSAARAISWYFPIVAFLRVCAIAAALGIGAMRVIDGSMSTGTLVAFLLYLDWFFQPIITLPTVDNHLPTAHAALAKLFDLVDARVLVDEREGA